MTLKKNPSAKMNTYNISQSICLNKMGGKQISKLLTKFKRLIAYTMQEPQDPEACMYEMQKILHILANI